MTEAQLIHEGAKALQPKRRADFMQDQSIWIWQQTANGLWELLDIIDPVDRVMLASQAQNDAIVLPFADETAYARMTHKAWGDG